MADRKYPSYWLYKDSADEWRWTYHARNGLAIAVSSESYKKKSDAKRGIEIMQGSASSPIYVPNNLVGSS